MTAAGNQPRAATAADITELVQLRAVMLSSLGQDPGGEDAPWRKPAVTWFSERLARPEEWAFRVIGPPGGPLSACGAAWLTEHLPGPAFPDGRRGYIGFMCTRPGDRRRGHGSKILGSLLDWLATRGVARLELHAAADGLEMHRRAGFCEDPHLAMYRMSSPSQ
jgi:GNAT superfamily N-acetyltransferase